MMMDYSKHKQSGFGFAVNLGLSFVLATGITAGVGVALGLPALWATGAAATGAGLGTAHEMAGRSVSSPSSAVSAVVVCEV